MAVAFSPEMIEFFLALRFNNNQTFFEENRSQYQQFVQQPLRALAEALGPTIEQIDAGLDVRPARVVSRIRRDTRFSSNKDPYRDHMWLGWRHVGEPNEVALCFYWEVSPETVHWGIGLWGEHKPLMDRIRRRIVAKPQEILQLYARCGVSERFTLQGNAYKRLQVPPEVVEPLQPLYLKKGFYFENCPQFDDFEALYTGAMFERVQKDFERIAPLYQWLRGCQQEILEETAVP